MASQIRSHSYISNVTGRILIGTPNTTGENGRRIFDIRDQRTPVLSARRASSHSADTGASLRSRSLFLNHSCNHDQSPATHSRSFILSQCPPEAALSVRLAMGGESLTTSGSQPARSGEIEAVNEGLDEADIDFFPRKLKLLAFCCRKI